MADQRGRTLVKEYYTIAPEIVSAIEQQKNALGIWKDIYEEIRIIVLKIVSQKYNEALERYKRMTIRLKSEYLKTQLSR